MGHKLVIDLAAFQERNAGKGVCGWTNSMQNHILKMRFHFLMNLILRFQLFIISEDDILNVPFN